MANTVLKPKEACFGQIFFSTNFEVGDRAEFDAFSKRKSPEKTIYFVAETRTPPILNVEKLDYDMVLITTAYSHYVCYQGHILDDMYNYATIGEVPTVGKSIEIVGHNKGTRYEGIYSAYLIPEEVNDRFKEYEMYIFKADGKVYLCFKR